MLPPIFRDCAALVGTRLKTVTARSGSGLVTKTVGNSVSSNAMIELIRMVKTVPDAIVDGHTEHILRPKAGAPIAYSRKPKEEKAQSSARDRIGFRNRKTKKIRPPATNCKKRYAHTQPDLHLPHMPSLALPRFRNAPGQAPIP